MRDRRLRELERRWRVSGAQSDELAYLSARLRAGELSADRLRWAAALGDPVARELAGSPGEEGDPDPEDASAAWSAGLDLLTAAEAHLFACACAREVLGRWSAAFPADARPARAIDAALGYARGESTVAELGVARRGAFEAVHEAAAAEGRLPRHPLHPALEVARAALAVTGFALRDAEVTDRDGLARRQAAAVAEAAARVEPLPFAPGNPVHDWQRELLAATLLGREGTLPEEAAQDRLPVYSPRFSFAAGQRLRHRVFGEGVVQRADARRIEVEFADGSVRALAQGREPAET